MCRTTLLACLAGLAVLALPSTRAHARDDDYAAMLGYLTSSHLDGHVLQGAEGSITVNLAAGDLNSQANLRAFATGPDAQAWIDARQRTAGNQANAPLDAQATIAGQVLAGAHGLVSINQVSGSANTQLNAVAAALASQGIRETTDGSLSAAVSASAEMQPGTEPDAPGEGTRSVSVAAGAMQGFRGVLQLNQTAGSGNATGNILSLSVSDLPR
ncbi:hypothetical protein [Frateuria soli]|uniref:hypothetical protein n=1 Tax=Frateuria soli TaxID=1542730 RepID=UPI001E552652|nr:hypothetical protein [Frateuria soli]UGB37727.1 hypothetical protein LQ771_12995 [Frateuria soli]